MIILFQILFHAICDNPNHITLTLKVVPIIHQFTMNIGRMILFGLLFVSNIWMTIEDLHGCDDDCTDNSLCSDHPDPSDSCNPGDSKCYQCYGSYGSCCIKDRGALLTTDCVDCDTDTNLLGWIVYAFIIFFALALCIFCCYKCQGRSNRSAMLETARLME